MKKFRNMFSALKRQKESSPQNCNSTPSPSTDAQDTCNGDAATLTNSTPAPVNATIVFENGTMFGAINEANAKLNGTSSTIPEIVISATYSSRSLDRSRSRLDVTQQHQAETNSEEETAAESTALLEAAPCDSTSRAAEQQTSQDEFEQFVLNRTTSESNILESSIYSELQFPPSVNGASIGGSGGVGSVGDGDGGGGGSTAQVAAPQTPSAASACSRDSRQTKRTRRKHKTKSKCSATAAAMAATQSATPTYPPQYTAIFLDPHHHNVGVGNAANAMGPIASAAASSAFLNPSMTTDPAYMQQFQYYQQRPLLTGMGAAIPQHGLRRSLFDVAADLGHPSSESASNPRPVGSAAGVTASRITPPLRLSFRKWFSRPSLPFVIGILALGGVACTLGGIVLGSTGLIEHSTQYLSAALLMIGIGVSLLVISGAIWRLSLPDDVDECPCYRHMEMCRNCNSPYCGNRLMPGSYLYPEFQHRPPPPSYLTSLNECAGMSLLFHPSAPSPAQQVAYSTLRVSTPPPLYRSTNSLSVFVPGPTNSRSPSAPSAVLNGAVPTLPSSVSILPDQNAITMSTVMENLHAQTQPLIKEFNYLELD